MSRVATGIGKVTGNAEGLVRRGIGKVVGKVRRGINAVRTAHAAGKQSQYEKTSNFKKEVADYANQVKNNLRNLERKPGESVGDVDTFRELPAFKSKYSGKQTDFNESVNYIHRIYDLLNEAIEISESNKASRKEKYRIRKKYKLDNRGQTSYSPETGEKTYKGRAGRPGTGKGGIPQEVAPMADIGDLTREVKPGAHTGSNRYTIGGDSRGVKKPRLTSTPRKLAAKRSKK